MDILTVVLAAFRPDTVFSLSFLIAFLGFGVFFYRQFWPWFRDYLNKKLEYEFMIASQRWEVMKALSDDLSAIKTDFAGFAENERKILDILLTK